MDRPEFINPARDLRGLRIDFLRLVQGLVPPVIDAEIGNSERTVAKILREDVLPGWKKWMGRPHEQTAFAYDGNTKRIHAIADGRPALPIGLQALLCRTLNAFHVGDWWVVEIVCGVIDDWARNPEVDIFRFPISSGRVHIENRVGSPLVRLVEPHPLGDCVVGEFMTSIPSAEDTNEQAQQLALMKRELGEMVARRGSIEPEWDPTRETAKQFRERRAQETERMIAEVRARAEVSTSVERAPETREGQIPVDDRLKILARFQVGEAGIPQLAAEYDVERDTVWKSLRKSANQIELTLRPRKRGRPKK